MPCSAAASPSPLGKRGPHVDGRAGRLAAQLGEGAVQVGHEPVGFQPLAESAEVRLARRLLHPAGVGDARLDRFRPAHLAMAGHDPLRMEFADAFERRELPGQRSAGRKGRAAVEQGDTTLTGTQDSALSSWSGRLALSALSSSSARR
jgi:hypothetical protein